MSHLPARQNWSRRIGFNYREGMTLHTVRYRDGDRVRSVAHRMSFAEMVVPYRDPSPDHYRRNAFDIGGWGQPNYPPGLSFNGHGGFVGATLGSVSHHVV